MTRTTPERATAARHPAHVVVLAAGRGSRLGELGDSTPKWLLRVGDRTLADRQLEGIARARDAVGSVCVVVGHAATAIEAALARRAERVTVVDNPEYAVLNNWWSLLRALRELPADGPVVVVNADLLAASDAIAAFVRDAVAGDADALLAVDFDKPLCDESMKVSLRPDGTLAQIGKLAIDGPVGEYVGMLAIRGEPLHRFRDVLESFVGEPQSTNEWYEAAVGRTAADGTGWRPWAMPPGGWVEIDDDADFEQAQALAAGAL